MHNTCSATLAGTVARFINKKKKYFNKNFSVSTTLGTKLKKELRGECVINRSGGV